MADRFSLAPLSVAEGSALGRNQDRIRGLRESRMNRRLRRILAQNRIFWGYQMSVLFLLAGVAVIVNRHARLAATWLAIAVT
jgi:hypothetical protein